MTSRFSIKLFTVLLALLLLGSFVSFTPVTKDTKSPYQSALANVGVGTAVAAGGCNGRICEAIQGLLTCLFEGGQTSCVLQNGACTSRNGCRP